MAIRNNDEYHLLTDNIKHLQSNNSDLLKVTSTGKNSRRLDINEDILTKDTPIEAKETGNKDLNEITEHWALVNATADNAPSIEDFENEEEMIPLQDNYYIENIIYDKDKRLQIAYPLDKDATITDRPSFRIKNKKWSKWKRMAKDYLQKNFYIHTIPNAEYYSYSENMTGITFDKNTLNGYDFEDISKISVYVSGYNTEKHDFLPIFEKEYTKGEFDLPDDGITSKECPIGKIGTSQPSLATNDYLYYVNFNITNDIKDKMFTNKCYLYIDLKMEEKHTGKQFKILI